MSRLGGFIRPLALVAVLGVSLLSGCGSEGDDAAGQQAPAALLARVDANCQQMRREAVALGRKAFADETDLAEAATQNIIKPSIPLLERFALRQQRLAKGSGDEALELYARLFEPVIVLTQERLRVGEEPGPQLEASKGFEILLTTVVDEQRQVAREAGLAACAVDFEKVLLKALRS